MPEMLRGQRRHRHGATGAGSTVEMASTRRRPDGGNAMRRLFAEVAYLAASCTVAAALAWVIYLYANGLL